ncbi:HNH endonuclease [Gryllotalpicola protaetiae]|uniref:HNH endonuclease n=1 Tax=Gryllotalpicola protaetiae TaxID=2419771 RepID=UPI0013C4725E|nr:HNH endonuclease signature motif containing protein [Gryllotalpicola protaetiae]
MKFGDVFDAGPGSGPVLELSTDELAGVSRGHVLDRVRRIDAEVAGLQAERVQLLGRLGDEAMLQAELDVAVDSSRSLDVRRNIQWRSAALELAAAAKVSPDSAGRQLSEAWTLTQSCQPTLAALSQGEIALGHARVIAREVAGLDGLAAGAAQDALLPYARRLSVGLFERKAREVVDVSDPVRVHDRHARAWASRHVSVDGARDGMATLTAYVDAGDAALIVTGLSNAAREARQAGDSRTRRQVEADFLVELALEGEVVIRGEAERLVDKAPVVVELMVPAATAAGDDEAPGKIPGIGMIDPVKARELIARAPSLKRILTDPITSAIIDFDRSTYRVPAELKRIIRLRDEHCRAPNCPRPQVDVDHTIDYAKGGKTARGNLAGLCENHHYVKHEAGWALAQYVEGILDWVSPSGRHYTTVPDVIMPCPPPTPWWDDDGDYADTTPFDKARPE